MLHTEVETAFQHIRRADFLPPEQTANAGLDTPLPIGYGQTNSQPSTMRVMLEWLDVRPGDSVLDVGSGSGWTTALAAWLTGPDGYVYAVEAIPELVRFGKDNCRRLKLANVSFHQAGPIYGLPEIAPFDRILVSAAAREVPEELQAQLAVGGKLVIPVGNNIKVLTRTEQSKWQEESHPGFVFVPLVKMQEANGPWVDRPA